MMFRSLLFALFLCIPNLISAQALADSTKGTTNIKKAAEFYDIGRERYLEGNFTPAAEAFEAADSYAPSAAALRLAIRARRQANQLERAATLAALALERHSDDSTLTSEAEAVLADASEELGQVHVTCDSPCELILDNRLVHGAAAGSRTLYAQPGYVTLRASWSDNRAQTEEVEVIVGDTREVSFYAPPLPSETPVDVAGFEQSEESDGTTEEKERHGWAPGVFWTGVALTTVGAASTVILGVNAINNPGKETILQECDRGDDTCAEYKKGRRNQSYANVAAGTTIALGVVTLITGVFLTDWGGGKKKESEKPRQGDSWGKMQLRPTINIAKGVTFGATGRF